MDHGNGEPWHWPVGQQASGDSSTGWLIASGNLSPLAALVPWLRFPLDPDVQEAFWLEPEEPPKHLSSLGASWAEHLLLSLSTGLRYTKGHLDIECWEEVRP
jgi:hypothetical protein